MIAPICLDWNWFPKFLIWFNSYGDIRCILDCLQYEIPTLIVISTFVYHFVIYVKSPHKLSLSRLSHPHLNLYQFNTSSSVWFTHSICHHFYQFFNTQSITNNSVIRSSYQIQFSQSFHSVMFCFSGTMNRIFMNWSCNALD